MLEHKRHSTVKKKKHFASGKHVKMVAAAAEKKAKQLTFTEASTSKTVARQTRNEVS